MDCESFQLEKKYFIFSVKSDDDFFDVTFVNVSEFGF